MKNLLIIISFVCLTSIGFAQNDIQFSQYMFNEITFNPAATGNTENLEVSALAREQWLDFEQHPSTQFVTANTYLKKIKSGIGFSVINDKLGNESFLNAKFNYSYRVWLSANSYMAFGLGMGFLNRNIKGSALVYENADDAYALKSDVSALKPDFDFGVGLVIKKLSFGFSATHVQQSPDYTSMKVPRHFYGYAKYVIPVNEHLNIIPSIRIKNSVYTTQTDANVIAQFNDAFWVGLSYRIQDAYVGMVGVKIASKLRIGYSYDFDATSMRSQNSGSHELFLSYSFRDLNKKPVNIKSPRLFN